MDMQQQQASNLVTKYHDDIDYFLKFGNPIEKAMAQVVLEAAGEQ